MSKHRHTESAAVMDTPGVQKVYRWRVSLQNALILQPNGTYRDWLEVETMTDSEQDAIAAYMAKANILRSDFLPKVVRL